MIVFCGYSMTVSPKNQCPKCRVFTAVHCALTSGSAGSSRGATRLRLLRGADLVGASKRVRHWRDMKRYEEIRYDQNDQVYSSVISYRFHWNKRTTWNCSYWNSFREPESLWSESALACSAWYAIVPPCDCYAMSTYCDSPTSTALRRSRQVLRPSATRQAATQAGLAPGQSRKSF